MWPLLFQGQITAERIEAHAIEEYLLFDSAEEDRDTWMDISDFAEQKITTMSQYVSQWSSGWYKYESQDLSPEEAMEVTERVSSRIQYHGGRAVQGFRYY